MEDVAVVIPIYRDHLSDDDAVSLECLYRHLPQTKKYIAHPESLDIRLSGAESMRYDDRHFRDRDSYSHLLLSSEFYQAFAHCTYILIYQLDCLVLKNTLDDWCSRGFDYIGAPLFVDKSDPSFGFSRVGNGGLSLRRTRAFIDTLETSKKSGPPWSMLLTAPPFVHEQRAPDTMESFSSRIELWRKQFGVMREARKGVQWYSEKYSLNEDLFWSDRARLFNPSFRVAPIADALEFAFEAHPAYCYAENQHRLPFGVHAWATWDRDFWHKHVLSTFNMQENKSLFTFQYSRDADG